MKIRSSVSFLMAVGLIACGKKTEVRGRVYSDHDIPVPYAGVGILQGKEKSYSYFEKTTTDADGYFYFTFRAKRLGNIEYSAQSRSDSGMTAAYPIKIGKPNDLNLRYGQ